MPVGFVHFPEDIDQAVFRVRGLSIAFSGFPELLDLFPAEFMSFIRHCDPPAAPRTADVRD